MHFAILSSMITWKDINERLVCVANIFQLIVKLFVKQIVTQLTQEALLGGVFMSPVWISNLSTSQFRKVPISLSEFCP